MPADAVSGAARAEIYAVFQRLQQAHAIRDPDAIAEAYSDGALIFDLAPPLGRRGLEREYIAEWLGTWDGPIRMHSDIADLWIRGDVAWSTGFTRMSGTQGGEPTDVWFRSTVCLQQSDGRWRIVHEHQSVPFYMDGSMRAATDLTPPD